MVYNNIMEDSKMHKYLSGFENFNSELPVYIKNAFSDNHVSQLKQIIEDAKNLRPLASLKQEGDQEEFYSLDRFDPRVISHMSRMIIEFKCPEEIEKAMDNYCLPLSKEKVKLCHYNYLDYDPKYGEGKYLPSLPPHIDAANTVVTFNYCLDTNIDWQIYIDNKAYDLKAGDAIVFSAVNQVHWRPKREWGPEDFCEIISFDYSPLDDWRFTDGTYPLDETLYPERVKEYMADLNTRKEYIDAWGLYNKLGLELGMDPEVHGKVKNGTNTNHD
jgi:hypothetical protein